MNMLQSGCPPRRVSSSSTTESSRARPTDRQPARRQLSDRGWARAVFVPEARKPLIDDFTLTVEPGQTIAIVGTGAGKTTVVNLLMAFTRFTRPITLDGPDYVS